MWVYLNRGNFHLFQEIDHMLFPKNTNTHTRAHHSLQMVFKKTKISLMKNEKKKLFKL